MTKDVKRLYFGAGVLAMAAGVLFIAGFLLLKAFFGYPEMIRAEPAVLLERLYEQREVVPYVYYAGVGLGGLCMFFCAILAGMIFRSEGEELWSCLGRYCGMMTGVLLYAGIIRYTFLFPFLAEKRALAVYDPAAVDLVFQAFNIYVGNSVTEHVEFTFTSLMLIFFSIAVLKTRLLGRWIAVFGFVTAAMLIYGNGEFLFNMPGAFFANRAGSAFMALWMVSFGAALVFRAARR